MLTTDSIIIRSEQIVQTSVGEEIVALDGDKGEYYGADGVAADVMQMLDEKIAISAIIDRLLEKYEVERAKCETEVMEFLSDLLEKDVIKIVS